MKKRYRQVFESNKVKLSENEKSILIHNGIGGISNKIGSIIVVSSDNVLLSIFTNLVTVGMYSNYTVLTAACSKVMQTISTAITPSLGQMGVEHDSSKNKEIFLELSFIIYSFSTFIFVGFFCFITPFVTVWVGKINVFPVFLTWLISINLWMNLIRTPSWMFADSFGLQWIQRWKSVVEAIANLGFSLVFLKIFNLGIEGIILGTILSTILVVLWYEPLTVFKHIIPELTLKKYINFNLPFIWIVVVSSLLFFIGNLIVSHYNSIFVNLINSCITFFITCAIYFVFFRKNKYYKKND
ncbi:lipopolysaccharide biosynthesis protein [Paucilactobacillus hokkaidonensis]|uniref:lipopolysaccharide biosynthesis protein n=1 Tax=Paucilactobacillus hokkaidonensis TaxID=1193095 RepID=UPI0020939797|nr:hypothetical protein [Paucilactobacillus hokkaidonensis]